VSPTQPTRSPVPRSDDSAEAPSAPVLEVFASIQGEGRYLGQPQVFVRLFGCPLRCRWCDTPGSWLVPGEGGSARLDLAAGRARAPARAKADELAAWVEAADPGGSRPVSVTGGEPLMWPEFLLALREALPGRRLHLETAGAFPRSLARVLDAFDHVSADLKCPQDLDAPVPLSGPGAPHAAEAAPSDAAQWREARREVLGLLAGRDACTKLVLSGARTLEELAALLEDQAELAPDVPLFLQPMTPVAGLAAPSKAFLSEAAALALSLGLSPRVVPQVHRLLGLP
jgi:7-carboxy-7-deazaguanine synthase